MIQTTFARGVGNPFRPQRVIARTTRHQLSNFIRAAARPVTTHEASKHFEMPSTVMSKLMGQLTTEGCVEKVLNRVRGSGVKTQLGRYAFKYVETPAPYQRADWATPAAQFLDLQPRSTLSTICKSIGVTTECGAEVMLRMLRAGRVDRVKLNNNFVYWNLK